MALDGSTVLEVRTTGDDNNGGGFAGDASLAIPSAPSLSTSTTGGSIAANTYYCVIAYKNTEGIEGQKSTQSSITTTGSTSTITVTSPSSTTNATKWAVYFSTTSGGPYFQQGTTLVIGSNRSVTSTPPTSGTQPFGTDYSQQNSQQVNIDNSTITTSITGSTITFTGYTPTAADVGNIVQFLSGTNITANSFKQIIGWTSTTWTVDSNVPLSGTTTNATAKMGGALASPGMAGTAFVAKATIWIKSGTYTVSTTANGSGGRLSITASALNTNPNRIYGYNSTRADNGTKPILQPSSNSTTVVTLSGSYCRIENIEFQANGKTSCTGLSSTGTNSIIYNCKANGFQSGIYTSGNYTSIENCYVTGCSFWAFGLSGANGSTISNCYAYNNSTTDFRISSASGCVIVNCISSTSSKGFANSTGCPNTRIKNCVAVNSTNSGFDINSSSILENCIAVNCTTYGYYHGQEANKIIIRLFNCAAYGNTPDYSDYLTKNNCITLTADPFINLSSGDFRLNTTSGGGASLRSAGYPSTYPELSSVSYPDIGPYQHIDATGLKSHPGMTGGCSG